MPSLAAFRLQPVWVLILACGGCGLAKSPSSPNSQPRQPVAPILGEPRFVRNKTGKVFFAQGASDAVSRPEEEKLEAGFRFIAIGFPISAAQTLAIDDYELIEDPNQPDESLIPFAVGGEGEGAPEYFYSTEDFADTVELSKGKQEATSMESQGPDEPALLVSWETPSPVVVMLFEVQRNLKTVTLRHGSRSFKLEPDSGLIDGKSGKNK